MIRKLLIVSASALVLAVVSLGIAWMIGGRHLVHEIKDNDSISLSAEGGGIAARTTRTLDFDPATPLTIEAPVELTFTRGDAPALTVEGPTKLIGAMRWEGGRLFLDKQAPASRGSLSVRITAPQLPSLNIKGPGQIELRDLRQPTLALTIAGAANVEGKGKVDNLAIDASGAGNLDLENLEAGDAKVNIAGLGNVDLSVTGKLDAAIAGAGSVTLHRKPQVIDTRITGIGSIEHDY